MDHFYCIFVSKFSIIWQLKRGKKVDAVRLDKSKTKFLRFIHWLFTLRRYNWLIAEKKTNKSRKAYADVICSICHLCYNLQLNPLKCLDYWSILTLHQESLNWLMRAFDCRTEGGIVFQLRLMTLRLTVMVTRNKSEKWSVSLHDDKWRFLYKVVMPRVRTQWEICNNRVKNTVWKELFFISSFTVWHQILSII